MFDSLSDRIKQDEQQDVKSGEKFLRWAAVLLISILLFGGLYLVVQKLEG